MRRSSVKYLIHEGLRNVWSNKLMSLASIGVLTACLLMVGFAILLTANLNAMVGYVGEQSTLAVFLRDDAAQEQVDQLEQELRADPNVKDVSYVSKDEALASYTQRVNNEAAVETLKEDNVLPASFNVSLYNLDAMDEVIQIAQESPAFDSVTAPTNIASTITQLNQTIGWFGAAIVIALVLVSLVIISNTIRATVFSRHREIAIMKQVGATNNFVRIPFLFEGIAIGVISAVIGFVLIWTGYEAVIGVLLSNSSAFLQSMFGSLVPFTHVAWQLGLGFLGGGMLAGATGSVISLRKHLRV